MSHISSIGDFDRFYRQFFVTIHSLPCRPSVIERRARRILKHAKIVPLRGISTKEQSEAFVKEACWIMGIRDRTGEIESVMRGLRPGVEVEPGWLIGCVREESRCCLWYCCCDNGGAGAGAGFGDNDAFFQLVQQA
jgi:hypothetical protein